MYTPLSDVPYTNKPAGSKVANLAYLQQAGFRVPPSVVVYNDSSLVEGYDYAERLEGDSFAVRSSGLAEDGAESSYAGQHDTFLHVKREDIYQRIVECRASGIKAEAYREAKGEVEQGICVLIQPMLDVWFAGVTFTSNPFSMNLNESVIEFTWGVGDKLVAGEVNPIGSYEICNSTNEFTPILEDAIMADSPTDVTESFMTPFESFYLMMQRVQRKCQDIAKKFDMPMDIEWAVTKSGILYILQARPVTTGARKWEYPEMVGRPVVSGRAEGIARWADPEEPLNSVFHKGDILLAKMTNPHMVPLMMTASGIATQIGGRTCHAAIVSRELNKPCVVSIGNLNILKSNTPVVLDAVAGKVIV
jgi:pyruvate,water dikinase